MLIGEKGPRGGRGGGLKMKLSKAPWLDIKESVVTETVSEYNLKEDSKKACYFKLDSPLIASICYQ